MRKEKNKQELKEIKIKDYLKNLKLKMELICFRCFEKVKMKDKGLMIISERKMFDFQCPECGETIRTLAD